MKVKNVMGLKLPVQYTYIKAPVCNNICAIGESVAVEDEKLLVLRNVILMTSGVSYNNFWYRTSAVEKAVDEAQERVNALEMFGEYNHVSLHNLQPADIRKSSHAIISLRTVRIPDTMVNALREKGVKVFRVDEPYYVAVVGDVVFLPTESGKEVRKIIESGFTISFSLYGIPHKTRNNSRFGCTEVLDFSIVQFDVVTEGGFKGLVRTGIEDAHYITPQEFIRRRKTIDNLREILKKIKGG